MPYPDQKHNDLVPILENLGYDRIIAVLRGLND
jgi:hypothetical protein